MSWVGPACSLNWQIVTKLLRTAQFLSIGIDGCPCTVLQMLAAAAVWRQHMLLAANSSFPAYNVPAWQQLQDCASPVLFIVGRRSLLVHYPASQGDPFCMVSAAPAATGPGTPAASAAQSASAACSQPQTDEGLAPAALFQVVLQSPWWPSDIVHHQLSNHIGSCF